MKKEYALIDAFTECKYKVRLLMEQVPHEGLPEIVTAQRERRTFLRKRWLEAMQAGKQDILVSSPQDLLGLEDHSYGRIQLVAGDLQGEMDGLEMSVSKGRTVHLPLIVSLAARPTEQDKMKLSFSSLILSKITGSEITRGVVICSEEFKRRPVSLTVHLRQTEKTIREITTLPKEDKEKHFFLNQHCGMCVYSTYCRKKALESDHLSLIQNMAPREIKKHNGRGLFTVTQLSHTFQPRREREGAAIKNNSALRALALREKKTYIIHRPKIPVAKTFVFLDVEGLPEQVFFT